MADTSEVAGLPAPTMVIVEHFQIESSVLGSGSANYFAVEFVAPPETPPGWTLYSVAGRLFNDSGTGATVQPATGLVRGWGSAAWIPTKFATMNASYRHDDGTRSSTVTYQTTAEYQLPIDPAGTVNTLTADNCPIPPAPTLRELWHVTPGNGLMLFEWDLSGVAAPDGWEVRNMALYRGTSRITGLASYDGSGTLTGAWSFSASATTTGFTYHGFLGVRPTREGWGDYASVAQLKAPTAEVRDALAAAVTFGGVLYAEEPPCEGFEARWWWKSGYDTSTHIVARGAAVPPNLPDGLKVYTRGLRTKKASGTWSTNTGNPTEVDGVFSGSYFSHATLTDEAILVSPVWRLAIPGYETATVNLLSPTQVTLDNPVVTAQPPWDSIPPTSGTAPKYVAEGHRVRLADGQHGKPVMREGMWLRSYQEYTTSTYPPVMLDRNVAGSWDPWEGPLEVGWANSAGQWGRCSGKFTIDYGYDDGFYEGSRTWSTSTPSLPSITPTPPAAPIPGEDFVFYATPGASHVAAARFRTNPAAQNGTRITSIQIQYGAVENVSLSGGAGARFRHDGEWAEAAVWVKVGGEWRPATAWVKVAGEWVQSLGGAGGEATFDVVGDGRTCAGAAIPSDRMHLPGVDEWETGIWLSSAYGWNGERYVALRGAYVNTKGPGAWSEWYLLDLGPEYGA